MRIVSLIASSTEIVCALGLEDKLVGRSHECDFPKKVLDLPVCTSPKFNTDGRSYMIDERVRAILQESLSVYRVDSDLLSRLEPTHIITQSQCDVCAVSLKDVEEAACLMVNSRPQIISLHPNCLADIYADIKRVGTALGAQDSAEALVKRIKTGIDEISKKTRELEKRPKVALIEWIDPLMAAGNWMPELVELAGGINVFGKAGEHSSVMSWKEVTDADPDVLIIAPCGFSMETTLEEMPLLTGKQGFAGLKSVKEGKAYIADGNQFLNRPGPRVLESLQILAEIIHPELFDFAHKGQAWQVYA